MLDVREVIELASDSYFAKGGHRACFEVPGEPNLCVKVELTNDPATRERVEEELRGHRKLLAQGVSCPVVSLFRGEVETNLGPGYLFDLVRNEDQSISPTLRNCGKDLGPECVSELVRNFYHEVVSRKLIVGDIHPKNLVVKDRSELVLIDGVGAVNFIWLYYWCGPLRVFKLRRKFRRLCRLAGISNEGIW